VQSRPVLTPLLIALNLGLFVVTAAQAGSVQHNNLSPLFVDWVTLPRLVAVDGEWWRLITGGFLHYGLAHVAVNMLALWLLGRDVEVLLGWPRFGAVYLLSLLGGSTAVFALGDTNTALAGASGAVWGVIGAMLVIVVRLKLNPQPVLVLIGINLFISFLPGISLLGHLGGFVVGAVVTAAMVYAPPRQRVPVQVGAVVGVLVVLLGVILAASAVRFSAIGF
jgi:membrane associated rhomboid family serine protease